MGLISEMHKGKGAPVGKKLPVPTTDGDDQVIAAKTGEYVLPPEVVAMIGVDKLDAMVAQMTGQPPGGKPAEMPEGMGMEMMEGEMPAMMGKGMKGHARGGLVSKFDGVSVDPFEKQSLGKYSFGADGSALDDSVSRQIDRASKGMMQSDEVFDAARPEIEGRMTRQPNGLLAQLMGYAGGGMVGKHMMKHDKQMMGYNDGGFIEDDVRRRLSGYNPQASIPPNATTNASPRAPELRNYTPEPGRVQPGATTPRISGLAANPPAGTPSATVRALDARVPGDAAAVEAQRAKAAAQAGKLTGEAQRAAATAAQPPRAGLAGRAVQTAGRIGSLAKRATPFALNAGVNQSFADMDTGYRDEFARSVGAESPMGNVAADTARTFANIGDAVTLGLAGRVGRGIASAAGGGSFGEGFAGDSDRDRFLASQAPQVAAAPQMTPKENSDEIARRRAALEGPQTAAAPSTPAPQASAPAPAAAPKRGPISGLAARAAQPAAAPANAAPMDGAVEIIRGQNRSWAVPELGYQEVPDEVYRSGKISEYMQAQSNNMLDRADPNAAELRTRLAEIAAQGDNSIRVSNATDRDSKGRGLRNQLAEIELQQRQQIAELEKQALAGNQEAVQRIQQLQQLRSRGDNDGRAKLVTDLVKAYSGSAMQPVGADGKPMSLEQYVNQGLALATGTVQSSSTPAGMKQVGTSGGKPVYQDAQGNRFIGD